jgi:hypothetical protein
MARVAGHDQPMPAPAEPRLCHRCNRPVEISRGQYDVFEHMHYVCFHYEFEHDPADPDEECSAGGCPSASINPRPERRPGPKPPRRDHVLASGWIWLTNVRRFFTLASFYVSYDFDDLDWQAIEAGIEALHTETDMFSYPISGRQELAINLSKDPGGDELTLNITGRPDELLVARLAALMDAFSL